MALRSSVVLTALAGRQSKFLFYFTLFVFAAHLILACSKKKKPNIFPRLPRWALFIQIFQRIEERDKRGRQPASNIHVNLCVSKAAGVIFQRQQVNIRLPEAALRRPPLA